jgi:hypothetical protein
MLALGLALAGRAQAEALDRLSEGGVIYGEVRPVALSALLKQLRVDQLPEVQKWKQQLGGIDVFDPALLVPTGIDVAAPIAVGIDVPTGAGLRHARIVATLRDANLFTLFAAGVAASGQAPIARVDKATPAGKAGILLVTTSKPQNGTAIARLVGDAVVVDAVDFAGAKPLPPVEIARRFPLDVQTQVALARGARRLFAPDTAAAFYADGRRLPELLEAFGRMDLEDLLEKEKPAVRAKLRAKRLAELKRCIGDWAKSPSSFDDAGVALTADRTEARLTLAWGTQGEPPLGGLRFAPIDDGGVDAELLAHQAPLVVALYAASAAPFLGVKRGGIFQSGDTLDAYNKRCGQSAYLGFAVRSWPQLAGTLIADAEKGQTAQQLGPLASALGLYSQLRNLHLILRDLTSPQTAQFALAATFDPSARTMLEGLLGILGATGATKTVGRRSPTVYALSSPGLGSFVVALESLGKGPLLFTFADSEESLQFAYRRATPMPNSPAAPTTPILSFHVDGATLAKLGASPNNGGGARAALDLIGRLRRLDAELAADGDQLRLNVRAPLKN